MGSGADGIGRRAIWLMLVAGAQLGCQDMADRGHLATAVERIGKCDFAGASSAADDALTGAGSSEARLGALLVKATAARRLGDEQTAEAIMEELQALEGQQGGEVSAAAAEMDDLASHCESTGESS